MGAEEASAVRAAVADVMDNGPWVGGPAIAEFERAFAAASGSRHVIAVANGTDALTLAMLALGLPEGSGILMAANEGGYSATAARSAGLQPVIADVDEGMSVGVPQAERALRSGVAAIVVTHLHGDVGALQELDAWRTERGLFLIEDCAQAHGARSRGRQVGTTGDLAAYSFYPTKNLGAIGDAGAVVTEVAELSDQVRALRQYGWDDRHRIAMPGGRNSRMDPLHAVSLTSRLPWLEPRNARRREIANRYRGAIQGTGLRMHGDPVETVAHHAVVMSSRRDELADHLRNKGIGVAIHYPYLLDEMPGLGLVRSDTPVARRLRDEILSLPCFPELAEHEVNRVVDALAEWRDHD
jgi:dTDP-4-amino-4,6-dideoxygalactose transaminase